MADLRLGRYEIEHYDPPPVCMRCGARSVVCKEHRFQWSPPWVYILLFLGVIPYAIVASATMKRINVPVPLCERHKWHWGGRTALVLVGLLAMVVLVLGGIALAGEDDGFGPIVFLPIGLLFLVWIVSAVVLGATAIKPREITDKSITLSGVSQEYIDALNEARRGEEDRGDRRRRDEKDDDGRPRARRRDEDDGGYYDPDEKRPRRRPPPDAIEEGQTR
jgi:hypothetical protein